MLALTTTDLFNIALGGLGIVGILSAAAAVARSSSIKENLALLRGEVTDLTAANVRLEAENDGLRVNATRQEQRISFLEDLATNRADITQLIGELRSANQQLHHDYMTIVGLFYRNPEDARAAQEAKLRDAGRAEAKRRDAGR